MQRSETTLDDLSTVVGYTATRELQAWWAGQQFYVPRIFRPDHALARLIGPRALRKLIERFAGYQVKVPTYDDDDRARRDRRVADLLAAGSTPAEIGAELGLSARRVEQLRDELLLRGWLEIAAGRRPGRGRRGPCKLAVLEPEKFGTGEGAGGTPPP